MDINKFIDYLAMNYIKYWKTFRASNFALLMLSDSDWMDYSLS